MNIKEYIYKTLAETKKAISRCINNKRYDDALSLISLCASLLYQTNIYYVDNDLENALRIISQKLIINSFSNKDYNANEDSLVFYDGFGLNDRGLIQIYLKALCKIKKVIYVTYDDRKNSIPDVQDILNNYNCERRYINRENSSYIDQVNQLNEYIKEIKPKRMFFYSIPNDVIATTVMSSYEDLILRYQINLTDHAFWLGASLIDRCIEFRNYGANISKKYRNIEEDKIVIVPFYPILHKEKKFRGFPFEKRIDQKVMFSGGALYKTIGDDNKYYIMVDYLLNKYNNLIFWYAGSGDDTEIKKIISKYPKRAFLTAERSDLFQIMEHSDVYLSTYPMCGGLMFQYAAMAGCVPVTLKNGSISDGFLINQENIDVEFNDTEHLYSEIDKLLMDDEYSKNRSVLMKKSVVESQVFDEEVRKAIEDEKSSLFPVKFDNIDTNSFREWYIENLSKADVDAMFVHRKTVKVGIAYYPFRLFRGCVNSAIKKLMKHFR